MRGREGQGRVECSMSFTNTITGYKSKMYTFVICCKVI